MSKNSILRDLRERFAGARRIKLSEAASVLGYSIGTCRNKIQQGKFPVKVMTERSALSNDKKHVRHYVALADLAEFQAGQEIVSILRSGKRHVGRPSKIEEMQRKRVVVKRVL